MVAIRDGTRCAKFSFMGRVLLGNDGALLVMDLDAMKLNHVVNFLLRVWLDSFPHDIDFMANWGPS